MWTRRSSKCRVTAPEGTSLAAMDEVMRPVEDRDLRRIPGAIGAGVRPAELPLGGVNTGQAYVRIAPHEERMFSLDTPVACASAPVIQRQAFRGNYTQRDVMQEVRRRLRKFRDLRTAVRNFPSFNIGGGNFEIDFAIRGPGPEAWQPMPSNCASRSENSGIVDADTTLKLDKPELRVEIDRARAADLRRAIPRTLRRPCA